jgi:acyl carrier protein
MSEVRAKIKKYIQDEFPASVDTDLDTVDLLEEEIVDSLGIFTLISFIESTFGLTVNPVDINLENFHSLDSITALVEKEA